ncbi:hypothetical protein [Bosea sp. RAC05]|uniref:hypothetical protein n=1 Tax=Bosea sp. RAC05 TaxID=1842539 RepID=UPI00083DC474|nr:hypothetical protein [Bosea sp. RAC05]
MQWFVEQILTKDVILAFAPMALTATFGLIGYFFAARPRIEWAVQFQNIYRVQEGDAVVWVHTRDLIIKNAGRLIAEDVEFVLNYPPMHVAMYPPVNHQVINQPGDRQIFRIERLNPQEFVLLSLLQTKIAVPDIVSVRYKGGPGKQIQMVPMRAYPNWFNVTAFVLFILGIYFSSSIVVKILARLFS